MLFLSHLSIRRFHSNIFGHCRTKSKQIQNKNRTQNRTENPICSENGNTNKIETEIELKTEQKTEQETEQIRSKNGTSPL